MNSKLDQTDCQILQILQDHAKITNIQLAERIALSPASTLERVKKLENQGIIKSYHAKLDPTQLSLTTTLWLHVWLHSLTTTNIAIFQEAIKNIPAIIACHQVMGDADFLAQVITSDLAAYQNILINQLSPISAIKRIKTHMHVATLKESGMPITSVLG